MDIKYNLKRTLTGMALALYAAMPAIADDIEIYTSGALGAPTVQPNIMFLVDTSGSMDALLTVVVDYDFTVTYAGGNCDANSLYYVTDGLPPGCGGGNKNYFDKAANKCDASVNLYDIGVIIDPIGPLDLYGYYTDQFAQRSVTGPSSSWQTPVTTNAAGRAKFIECKADSGIHGETSSANPYIENNTSGGWTSTVPDDPNNPHPVWSAGANSYTLYDGNYLNYLQSSPGTTTVSRLDVVKKAVQAMVDSNNNINLGLMVFDSSYGQWEGGAVQFPNLSTNLTRNDFKNRLGNLKADGSTPLSELYYEALLYYGGKVIDYSDKSNPSNVIGTLEAGNIDPSSDKFFETPITETCQKNYIILLSDGAPQQDYISQTRRSILTGSLPTTPGGSTFYSSGSVEFSCNTDDDPGKFDAAGNPVTTLALFNKNAATSVTATDDNCLDELASWARNNDVAEREIYYPSHEGKQTITTYTVGFDFDLLNSDLVAAEILLRDTATAGGGSFFVANDQGTLNQAFSRIVAEILAINSTFSSPAVSVNAFNRATNLDDLYFTLFKPTLGEHWEGNFKKFMLDFDTTTGDPFIGDQNGDPAIDTATGFFRDSSVSFWTAAADAPDGAETAVGGAASNLTLSRNIFTFTGTYADNNGVLTPSDGNLTTSGNALDWTNTSITDAMLGGVAANPDVTAFIPDGVATALPYTEALLRWAFGYDINDADGDVNSDEARRVMGDPLHAEPALVQYGQLVSGEPDLVAYVATNDGYLHAINTLDGSEYFAFVPQEMLLKLDDIFQNTGVNGKQYGLDGNVVPWINDANNDGDLNDAGEFVYIYYGMRRGGQNIYSMDVSNRNSPTLRWMIEGGTGNFAELGETWSTVNVEQILINDVKTKVLIFGGGYDVAQDSAATRIPDTVGRGVFIVDATTGALLWRAGPDGGGADLPLTDMQYSIPARVKPIDIDGDGSVDRLYVGDMGGQLWRFDIDNSLNTSSSLSVQGGVIADLAVNSDLTAARRFYYPPDIALIVQEGQAPFLAIVAASGYRAHPLNTDIQDRMYMIRDFDVYSTPDYSSLTPITEADLFDTTDNVIGQDPDQTVKDTALTSLTNAAGWFISLEELDGAFVGEKALSEPLLIGGVAIITTYTPASAGINPSACTANDGTGAIYFLNVVDGTPTYDLSGTDGLTREDRKVFLDRGGIPPSPTVIITEEGTPTLCVGTECERAASIGAIQKMYWYEK